MYNTLKGLIDQYIIENTSGEITGEILNNVLNQMVSVLGSGSKFKGSIQPESEAPSGTEGENDYFYIATSVGTYTNFGDITVSAGELAFVKKEDSSWVKYSWDISSLLSGKQDTISDLEEIRIGASAGASAYQKPQNGIPKTDLATDVQTSLDKADTALQQHQDISGKADKSETYTKSEVDAKVVSVMRYKGSVNNYAALSAIQNPSVGDVYNVLDTGHNYAYDGTSWDVLSGIVSVEGKADKVSNATNGNFAGLDENGNIMDSSKKASDFATSSQGAKADTAYQKPSSGIPESDLSSDVQQALQKHFKGWLTSTSQLPSNPVVGDYAYVKGATATDPAAIYECATAGSWSDSGRTVDTSNVQTFQTGEEVNQTPIDDTNLVNPKDGALAKAEDVMQLKAKLEGVTASETKVTQQPITGSYIKGADGTIDTASNVAYIEVALGNNKSVRFLGAWFTSSSYSPGYAFGHYTDPSDPTTWVTDKSSIFDTNASVLGTKEYVIAVPEGATHFRTTTATNSIPALTQNFYCYLQSGDSVGDMIQPKSITPKIENGFIDFAISDENGNDIVEFLNGEIRTKKFDSSNTPTEIEGQLDFSISDESGNNILVITKGYIATKNFDSRNVLSDNALLRQLTRYKGKKLSILGDSISTFGSPSATNENGTYCYSYYPTATCRYSEDGVDSIQFNVNDMYWMKLLNALGMTLGINESYRGTKVAGSSSTAFNNQDRIDHLGLNGTPDVILIFGGANDAGSSSPSTVGTFTPFNPKNYTDEQIAALPVDTFANAYSTMLVRVMKNYPHAEIISLLPTFAKTYYDIDEIDPYNDVIKEICDFFGVKYIDTRVTGINVFNVNDYIVDNVHPNAAAMQLLFEKIYRQILFT